MTEACASPSPAASASSTARPANQGGLRDAAGMRPRRFRSAIKRDQTFMSGVLWNERNEDNIRRLRAKHQRGKFLGGIDKSIVRYNCYILECFYLAIANSSNACRAATRPATRRNTHLSDCDSRVFAK